MPHNLIIKGKGGGRTTQLLHLYTNLQWFLFYFKSFENKQHTAQSWPRQANVPFDLALLLRCIMEVVFSVHPTLRQLSLGHKTKDYFKLTHLNWNVFPYTVFHTSYFGSLAVYHFLQEWLHVCVPATAFMHRYLKFNCKMWDQVDRHGLSNNPVLTNPSLDLIPFCWRCK